jgi:plastocyanin
MTRGLSTVVACGALVLAAGCGSSSSSTGSSTGNSTATTHAATTPIRPGGGLKTDTTPKYASPSSSAPVLSGIVQIAYRNITIQPDALKAKVGSTIRWTNYDSVRHTVTSESGPEHFASSAFGEGRTFEVKLTKTGVIHYECTIHPVSMNGTIEVLR